MATNYGQSLVDIDVFILHFPSHTPPSRKNKKEYVDKAIQLSSDIKNLQKLKIKNFEIYKQFTKNKQSNVYKDFQKLLKDLLVKHSSNTFTKV